MLMISYLDEEILVSFMLNLMSTESIRNDSSIFCLDRCNFDLGLAWLLLVLIWSCLCSDFIHCECRCETWHAMQEYWRSNPFFWGGGE